MDRVLVLGRGGAGKSTFARQLSAITGLPAVELDKHFWSSCPQPLAPDVWAQKQVALAADDTWILDGDLGPYDVLDARLTKADTVIVLDYSFARCAWRAARRSREGPDFWRWVWHYRRRHRPLIQNAIRAHAADAAVHWLSSPRQARQLLVRLATGRQ